MASTTPEQVERGYAILYENVAMFPELGRFRRFADLWSKLVHEDTREVLFWKYRIEEELEKVDPTLSGVGVLNRVNVLDIPRNVVQSKYPTIYKRFWKPYEAALRRHGRDLCTSSQIMQLPDQAAYATTVLGTFEKPIFDHGRFGLTQEPDRYYLGPSAKHAACAWRVPPEDSVAQAVSEMAPWFRKHVYQRFCNPAKRRQTQPDDQSTDPPYVRYRVLVKTIDILTCIFASIFLMVTMFVLVSIPSSKSGIGAAGALGAFFSVSVMLLAGPSRRIEVYAATGAFFAVACTLLSGPDPGKAGT